MSFTNSLRVAGPFNGNGTTDDFVFTFKAFTAEDVLVVLTDSSGVETVQTLTTHYSVVLNSDQNVSPGGTVTMVTPPASGEKLTLSTNVNETQPLVIRNQGAFYPRSIEDAFDRNMIVSQQLSNKVGRALLIPISDGSSLTTQLPSASNRAQKALVFDASGNVGVSSDNYNDQLANVTAQANAAANSAAAAATSESNAATSESNADDSATEAENWANYPENSLVPEGDLSTEYSAYHWAQKAAAVAGNGLRYQGEHDASTTVYPDSPNTGDLYRISVGGTISGTAYVAGDDIYYNGSSWSKIDNAVSSVAGKTGAVTLVVGDITNAGTAALLNSGTASGNVPVLQTGGLLAPARLPQATDSALGAVELASTAEAEAGTDTARGMTPARTQEAIAALENSQVISTFTVSTAIAAVDFLNDFAAPGVYVLSGTNVTPATDNVFMTLRVSVDGVNAEAGASDYAVMTLDDSVNFTSNATSGVRMNRVSCGNDTGEYGNFNAVITVHDNGMTFIDSLEGHWNTSTNWNVSQGGGLYIGGGGQATGVQFSFSSGNIVAGTFELRRLS